MAALKRHIALVGFMGAGKTSLGVEAGRRTGLGFADVDAAVEHQAGDSIADFFKTNGEAAFRKLEEEVTVRHLELEPDGILALGGGAVTSAAVKEALRAYAVTVWVDVDVDTAWERARGTGRPLAQDEGEFRRLFDERRPVYEDVADVTVTDTDGIVLAAGGIYVERGSLERLGELVPGRGAIEIVADARVAGIYGMETQLALGTRAIATHELPPGEAAKTVGAIERLWRDLRLDRSGTLVALGGGCTTDTAGFVAATYMRGIDWVAVPTTLVGQVDAAIGGKTAIDLPGAKNIVGAFHWPVRTIIDPALLETLPEAELLNGRAEMVKTGLLAGEPLWELPLPESVRRCAAFKTAICLRDPHDRGDRRQLNLGHTFAHALEAAAGYELPHGRAVALGLLAALRLSGLDTNVVEEILRPEPVKVDRELAWEALMRDKKAVGGVPRLVLLDSPGVPHIDVPMPKTDVRAALDALIAG